MLDLTRAITFNQTSNHFVVIILANYVLSEIKGLTCKIGCR